jgi:hypothetical protein
MNSCDVNIGQWLLNVSDCKINLYFSCQIFWEHKMKCQTHKVNFKNILESNATPRYFFPYLLANAMDCALTNIVNIQLQQKGITTMWKIQQQLWQFEQSLHQLKFLCCPSCYKRDLLQFRRLFVESRMKWTVHINLSSYGTWKFKKKFWLICNVFMHFQ